MATFNLLRTLANFFSANFVCNTKGSWAWRNFCPAKVFHVYGIIILFLCRCVGARERGDVMKAFNLQCVVLQYPPF